MTSYLLNQSWSTTLPATPGRWWTGRRLSSRSSETKVNPVKRIHVGSQERAALHFLYFTLCGDVQVNNAVGCGYRCTLRTTCRGPTGPKLSTRKVKFLFLAMWCDVTLKVLAAETWWAFVVCPLRDRCAECQFTSLKCLCKLQFIFKGKKSLMIRKSFAAWNLLWPGCVTDSHQLMGCKVQVKNLSFSSELQYL